MTQNIMIQPNTMNIIIVDLFKPETSSLCASTILNLKGKVDSVVGLRLKNPTVST